MIYVASPYCAETQNEMNYRAETVAEYTAHLMVNGITAFSPIVHCHQLLKYEEFPRDWDFWKQHDYTFLKKSEELHVLMIPGWEKSKGVSAEIDFAVFNDMNIVYVDSSTFMEVH